jgi:SAM-dependent methyltransferase
MDYTQILEARMLFASKQNVSQRYREDGYNKLEVLELVYDLQAGSYVEYAEKNREALLNYAVEMGSVIRRHIKSDSSLLDVGCGEMTTLSFLLANIGDLIGHVHAFDVSLSRLLVGKRFAKQNMGSAYDRLNTVAAELQAMPYRDSSISVCISNHALEPNGGQERVILKELFRVARDYVLLFEPYYEGASQEAKARMDAMGYVRGLEKTAQDMGAEVLEVVQMTNIRNSLNPTACFVLRPPKAISQHAISANDVFSMPGTDLPLQNHEEGLISRDTGMLFPRLVGIPILRRNSGVHANALI